MTVVKFTNIIKILNDLLNLFVLMYLILKGLV